MIYCCCFFFFLFLIFYCLPLLDIFLFQLNYYEEMGAWIAMAKITREAVAELSWCILTSLWWLMLIAVIDDSGCCVDILRIIVLSTAAQGACELRKLRMLWRADYNFFLGDDKKTCPVIRTWIFKYSKHSVQVQMAKESELGWVEGDWIHFISRFEMNLLGFVLYVNLSFILISSVFRTQKLRFMTRFILGFVLGL